MPAWPRIVTVSAFALMVFVALVGAAYVNGDVLIDPGGSAGVAVALSWCAATAALAAYATSRPGPAAALLVVLTILTAALVVIGDLPGVAPVEAGQAGLMSALGVAIALGFLGVPRPVVAGPLLLIVGLATAGTGGTGAAIALPVLTAGGLFGIAAVGDRHPRGRAGGRPRPGLR
ncbi:hypothetical protein [Actinoplanes sp. NPDC049265]|uniref:hypothetical protein n=1 Tax=Actinoplanes sp. NPDC049265 TaxID=3363902 RepID=UPI0037186307